MTGKNGKFDINPLWCILEEKFNIETNKHYEGLFTQGSGYMSVRGSFEEGLDCALQDEEYVRSLTSVTVEKPRNTISKWGTFVPGIMGKHPLLKDVIINLPYFLEFNIWFDDEKLDMDGSYTDGYRRWLDLRDGVLQREFIWNTRSGSRIYIYFNRFISMENKNICIQKINIKILSGKGELRIESGINGRVRTNGYNHFVGMTASIIEKKYLCIRTATDTGDEILEISSVISDGKLLWNICQKENHIFVVTKEQVICGQEFEIVKLSSVVTDRDMEKGDLCKRGLKAIQYAEDRGCHELYEKHATIWKDKWDNADIRVEGDDRVQFGVRFSIYHLIRSNAEDDPRVSICAKGHAGEAYYGRYFWDTEIYVLPFFIYTNPKAARNLIMFRYKTLEGARENARSYGYNGARYPWQSSLKGVEQCTLWEYSDNEIHVTADIVYALWHYYNATGDYEFMLKYGIDIMVETSRYWAERVDKNTNGGYDIIDVMGPDEYKPFLRNNAFTNRMVKHNLEKTVEFLKILNKKELAIITKRLKIKPGEVELFKEIAGKLQIPYNSEKNLILQSENFEGYADIDMNALWKDKKRAFGHFISQEKLYRSKCLKQADVLTLMMLFTCEFTIKQIRTAYEYYEPITTHDSSLSPVSHAFMAVKAGKMDEAKKFLKKAVDVDLYSDKGGSADGIHIANCGGIWQLMVYGFAGLGNAVWEKEIKLEPHLPRHIRKIEFPVIWHSKKYRITVTREDYRIMEVGVDKNEEI